jgi:hypothetical protein
LIHLVQNTKILVISPNSLCFCSCVPPLVDDCLKDGYMSPPQDMNDEYCYFMRPIFGCKDYDSLSGDS